MTTETGVTNSIRFVLPMGMPVSVNSLYQIIYRERRVELKPEARTWKTKAKEYMPPWKMESSSSLICIESVFYYNFYCKNGELREYDSQNLVKLLHDAVAERYGFNDKRVKKFPGDSYHSLQDRVIVTVSEYYANGDGTLKV